MKEYNALDLLEETVKNDKKAQKRIKKFKFKRLFSRCRFPIFIICTVLVGFLAYKIAPSTTIITYIDNKILNKSIYEKPNSKGFVNDTNYNGFKYTDCYDFQFQRTKNYMPNKELELSGKEKEEFSDYASKCVNELFNINYEILMHEDYHNLSAQLQSIYSSELLIINDEELSVINYSKKIHKSIIENEINIKAKLLTDNSLIFQDNGITYVRGVMEWTPFHYENTEFLKRYMEFNQDIIKGNLNTSKSILYEIKVVIPHIEQIKISFIS